MAAVAWAVRVWLIPACAGKESGLEKLPSVTVTGLVINPMWCSFLQLVVLTNKPAMEEPETAAPTLNPDSFKKFRLCI